MKDNRICILGGTGFVGRHLTGALTKAGYTCRILTRRPERHRDLRLYPRVEVLEADPFDRTALAAGLAGCQTAVNLVGILNEGRAASFRRVHVELVERLVEAGPKAGIDRYLHMSALHADAKAGSSAYLRTKGEGEDLVHAQGAMTTTSFRPSVIFGRGDSFFNRFAGLLRLSPRVMPLACPQARFAPVYVGDVAAMMVWALRSPASAGQRYDLCGPRVFTLKELVEYTARTIGRPTLVIGLGDFASRLQGRVLQLLPGAPFTLDNYLSLQTDSVCKHNALAKAGITPTDVDAVVPTYLRRAGR